MSTSPDSFRPREAAAIQREDIDAWAASNDIVTTHGEATETGARRRRRAARWAARTRHQGR
ncbi:hypothetical protein [Tessaracoccus flavescens]|uniref:Uncharacterized protein n=1 Tax=Tessaracoccus flavescens TaxID=399497 RepID=A0A1Q2CYK3_9ACTN|nr:hypothetical protein [Tessaracoccus flavescens]AQP51165.1 hypothetical protein BW733_10320 [Tessaracoccus flavescens]